MKYLTVNGLLHLWNMSPHSIKFWPERYCFKWKYSSWKWDLKGNYILQTYYCQSHTHFKEVRKYDSSPISDSGNSPDYRSQKYNVPYTYNQSYSETTRDHLVVSQNTSFKSQTCSETAQDIVLTSHAQKLFLLWRQMPMLEKCVSVHLPTLMLHAMIWM